MMMALSNHGNTFHGIDPKRPKASLLEQVPGATTATPQYIDTRDGRTLQTGYVVRFGRGMGEEWFTLYTVAPWEKTR